MKPDEIQKKLEAKIQEAWVEEKLPQGFDERFFKKLALEPKPQKKNTPWIRSAFAATVAAGLLGIWWRMKGTHESAETLEELALSEEIDFYDDLDVMMHWDESEEVT